MNNWKSTTGWIAKKGKDISGEFRVTDRLYDNVSGITQTAGVSTGMSGAALTVFTYDEVANLVLDSQGHGFTSVDDIRKAVAKKVKEGTLKITSITLDPTGSKVVLGVGADVAPGIAGQLVSKIYDFSASGTTVTVKVFKKDTLVANWGETPVCEKTVTITDNLDTLVDVPIEGIDMTSGFFKVEVVQ